MFKEKWEETENMRKGPYAIKKDGDLKNKSNWTSKNESHNNEN